MRRLIAWLKRIEDGVSLVRENNDLREERDELIVARRILWQRIDILIEDRDRLAEMVEAAAGRKA